MSESEPKPDAFEASGTSPPVAVAAHHNRSDYIAEGFKNRTHGEAKFNFRTYVGLGFFGALAASLGLTVALRDSKWIAPQYEKILDLAGNLTKFGKTGEALAAHKANVNSLGTIATMFTGTTIMAILPIKWREDHKAEIIKKYDRDYYGEERVNNDPMIKQAHALIDAAPKQTWKSVIGSRFVALAATLGVAHIIGSNESILGVSRGWSIDKMSIKAGRALDGLFNRNPKAAEAIAAATKRSANDLLREGAGADRMASRIFNYLTLDGLYTLMTSSVLFVFTRVLAPVFDKTLPGRANTLPEPIRDSIGSRAVLPLPGNNNTPATKHAATSSTTAPDTRVGEASLAPGRVSPEIGNHVTA
ncbi:MAG: hypothetical protein ACKVOE_02535 [Rickettsiales bacterium]